MTTNSKEDKQEHRSEVKESKEKKSDSDKKSEGKSETKIETRNSASVESAKVEITKDLIKHVAGLARLNLSEKELEKFVPELKEIISTFSQLNEVNVEDVEPSFQPVELKNTLRDDLVKKSFTQEEALSNSEHKKEGYFKGPSVL